MEYQALPYIMRYESYKHSPFKGMYITIARWCNQPSYFKKLSFRQFCIRTKECGSESSLRYLNEFEQLYPDIAKEYFDMKWSDYL